MRARKYLITITLSTVAGASACGDVAAPTGDIRGVASTVTSAVQLPFSGRIVGALTAIPPFAPGSSPQCNQNFTGDPTAPGPSISLFDQATGNFSHLGRVALDALSCLDPASPSSGGQGTITAANGDLLFIAFENASQPDPADPTRLSVSGSQWVTGGTGRFQGASGTQWCTFVIVLLSPSTGNIEGGCDGYLDY